MSKTLFKTLSKTRIVPMLAVAAYFAAATLPCPIPAEISASAAGAISYSHSDHDHADDHGDDRGDASMASATQSPEKDPSAPFFTKPCPCGCEGNTGGTLATKRLGRLIPPETNTLIIAPTPTAQTPHLRPVSDIAASPPELIPILS
jgi:hypothetical protein